jgi:hypothetical protein
VGHIEARGELEYFDSLLEDLDSTIILRDGTGDDATHEVGNDEGDEEEDYCDSTHLKKRLGGVYGIPGCPLQILAALRA